MEIVGQIRFDGYNLDVYGALDAPCFLIDDVVKLLELKNNGALLDMLEEDEIVKYAPLIPDDQLYFEVYIFITELGFYNALSQTKGEPSRKWRRIIHSNLIMMRREHKLTIEGQFDEWDAMADNLYIDTNTGILMQSITLPGGDVEQVPYEE